MITFGEYLLRKQAVSADDLSSAYVNQVKSTPSPGEIAHACKLLDAAQLLAVFGRQNEEGTDFVSACKALGLWTPAIAERIRDESRKARRSYVADLIDRGLISQEKLSALYDAYLSEAQEPADAAAPPAAPPTGAVLPENVHLFAEQFNEESRDRLFAAVERASEDPAARKTACEVAHRLYGAAQFSGFAQMTGFFKELERRFAAPPGSSLSEKITEGVRAAWELREHLARGAREDDFEAANPGSTAVFKRFVENRES